MTKQKASMPKIERIHVVLSGTITVLTGATVSHADSRRTGTHIALERIGGCLYLPGSTIRGKLRHLGFQMLQDKLLATTAVLLRVDDAYWFLLGGVKQAGESTYDALLDRPALKKFPFIGLFGCAEPCFVSGNIQVESALAAAGVEPDTIYGQRSDPIQRDELDPEKFADTFDAYIADLAAGRTARKKKKAATAAAKSGKKPAADDNGEETKENGKVATPMPFSREIIPPNTQLEHTMVLRNATDIEFGLFLATLTYFSKDARFGAQLGQNLGVVNLSYDVTIDGKAAGKIAIDGRRGTITMSDDLLDFEQKFWKEFPNMVFKRPGPKAEGEEAA